MAHIHNGIDNRALGNIHTDEEFSDRLRHVTKMIRAGIPVCWYCNKFNVLMIRRNNQWWSIDNLAKVEPKYDWTK